MQIAIRQQPRVTADRRPAGTVERRQQRPLGGGDGFRLRVFNAGVLRQLFGILGANGNAYNALASGRHHQIGAERQAGPVLQPQPPQPGKSQ